MDKTNLSISNTLSVDVSENDGIAGSKDLSGFPTASTATSKMKPLSLDAIEEIAGSKDFSGFLTAHEISQALESEPSAVLSMTAEKKTQGQIDHPPEGDRPQTELEEPLANSTLVEQAEEGSNPSVPVISGKQRRRHLQRQRRRLQARLARLTVKPNRSGSQVPEAGTSSAQMPEHGNLSAKRQKTGNSGVTPEPKRARQGGSPAERPSYAAASRGHSF